jgi:hypothetical protein
MTLPGTLFFLAEERPDDLDAALHAVRFRGHDCDGNGFGL